MEVVPQLLVNGLVVGVVYSLIALGLTLAFSILRILNFAHGEFYMLGAYTAFFFVVEFGLNYWAALPLAILLGGLLGLAVDQGLLRQVGRDLMRTLLITLGLTMVLQGAAIFFFGSLPKAIPDAVSGMLRSTYVTISKERLVIAAICIALILALLVLIKRTKLGQAMRAVVQDRDAALLQGINVELVTTTGFAIACGLASAAGALMGTVLIIDPFIGGGPLLKALVIIILGGMGSIPGAVLGGLILGLIESFLTFYASSMVSQLVFFVLIILVFFVRPRGLFGVAE